ILRRGQCLKEGGQQKIAAAKKLMGTPNLKPEQVGEANRMLDEGMKMLRDGVQYCVDQAEQFRQKNQAPEVRARLMYDAAWGYRALAEPEIAAARSKIQQDLLKKLQDEAAKKGQPAVTTAPEVAMEAIPVQPSEEKARAQYQAMIAAFSDQPLATEARFE